ncbi:MAG: hypothetical protein WD096_01675 [Actinomycetota bacterium]
MRKPAVFIALLGLIVIGPLAGPAQAYVDPGTGSFVFQALIGGALAAAVAVKVFWTKIVGVFSRKERSSTED